MKRGLFSSPLFHSPGPRSSDNTPSTR
jgi:hypothetical protein